MDKRARKICFVASAGGHLSELIQIAGAFHDESVIWVSTGPMVVGLLQKFGPVHIVGECNRQHPIRSFRVAIRCLRVVFRERPSIVISAAPLLAPDGSIVDMRPSQIDNWDWACTAQTGGANG